MTEAKHHLATILVKGIVQGVGFRPFIYRIATSRNLKGTVRNLGDAGVEIKVFGSKDVIGQFIQDIRTKKPPLSEIYDISTKWSVTKDSKPYNSFRILKSSNRAIQSGSILPADVATCDNCLNELKNPKDRRYQYFFITCTDCGPRYTTITKLPYDRPHTTLDQFPMCDECRVEYENPRDRRFHAQTIACPRCGPKVFLTDAKGRIQNYENPIAEAGRLLDEDKVLAIKGNGGFHIACATTDDAPIQRLRHVKHRKQKPFALMSPNIQVLSTFTQPTLEESRILQSYIRPIVLLEKSEEYHLSEMIAPGLHNVGVMLPYTALHHLLFEHTKQPALVMTSANPPSEPIIIDNDVAINQLGPLVDYFLMHNRTIAQRCDDSVLRMVDNSPTLIRRSRGYAPMPIHLKTNRSSNQSVLALGAQWNVNACILTGNSAFISQYIGDIEAQTTLDYLKSTIKHLLHLTNTKIEIITCDLHPSFPTTRLAYQLAEEKGCKLIQVQHHHAHLAGLMAEQKLNEMVGIACDGVGYGPNGQVWGGEVFIVYDNNYKRMGHLQEHPMPGGDLATRFPIRMTASILHKHPGVKEWLETKENTLPHGREELNVIQRQLERSHRLPIATSTGRVLDAVSALLGVCYERTYQGEPAIKLESVAIGGTDVLKLDPITSDGIINTKHLLATIFEQRNKFSKKDLAYSAHTYLAKGLAQIAIKVARNYHISTIGLSGGVAYNNIIVNTIRKEIDRAKLKIITHQLLPPGDGGISLGQAWVAANSDNL